MSTMPDTLNAADVARMKAEHVAVEHHCTLNGEELPYITIVCVSCFQAVDGDVDVMDSTPFPCDAALLLAELERRNPPTIATLLARMEQQRLVIQSLITPAGITVTGGWAGPSALRPSPDVDPCHCGAEGLEPAHSRHGL